MIFLHETHEISGGRISEFEESFRREWQPLVEADGRARLLWYWHHTHGTGPSYQAVTLSAVRDWQAWGTIAAEVAGAGKLADWSAEIGAVRREVTSKILLPAPWSPIREADLAAPPAKEDGPPGIYLHDTGWPFPGRLHSYVRALGEVYYPQVRRSQMISVEGCWMVAAGTGRHHEVVLLQRVLDWQRFSHLLTDGEAASRAGEWMQEGLRHRDRWESKLLRSASWSPRR